MNLLKAIRNIGWQECELLEFVASWEKDVLQSRWNEQYAKCKQKEKDIILNPDCENPEHVAVLMRLAKKDGILGRLVKSKRVRLYKKILSEREFRNLTWCSKNPRYSIDEIDLITNKTRKLKDIMRFIRTHGFTAADNQYVKNHILRADAPDYRTNRLYISKTDIIDGNHRAAANMMSIVLNGRYVPMLCFRIEKVK